MSDLTLDELVDDHPIARGELGEIRAEPDRLRGGLEKAREWLEVWGSAEPYISQIDAILGDAVRIQPGACPYPINGKRTERECREAGQCGCQSRDQPT
jgi:hypothetical protein